MKLHPILFQTAMVQALLAGTKTQTRRLVKPQPIDDTENSGCVFSGDHMHQFRNDPFHVDWKQAFADKLCRYEVGDILWVRETWRKYWVTDPETGEPDTEHIITEYAADGGEMIPEIDGDGCQVFNKDGTEKCISWRPSLFMPREACRLFLKIKSIRVERLLGITEGDARAEGITIVDKLNDGVHYHYEVAGSGIFSVSPAMTYQKLWESINGKGSWEENPFVWVYEFERTEKP